MFGFSCGLVRGGGYDAQRRCSRSVAFALRQTLPRALKNALALAFQPFRLRLRSLADLPRRSSARVALRGSAAPIGNAEKAALLRGSIVFIASGRVRASGLVFHSPPPPTTGYFNYRLLIIDLYKV